MDARAKSVELDRGVFTLSFDFELAWGSFDSGRHRRYETYCAAQGESVFDGTRRAVDGILATLARNEIPATWAIVGHLFLDRCATEGGVKHGDVPHARHDWYPRDWYSDDPASDVHAAPMWYAPDLVQKVLQARPAHDVGSHSFSHVIFADRGCPREVADAEVGKCVELARARGIEMRSFVFPRNQLGHVDVVARHGFRAVRAPMRSWYMRAPLRVLRRGLHVVDDVLALTPPCELPRRHRDGVWLIPTTMFLQGMEGPRRFIPARSRVLMAKRGIDRAITDRSVFSITTHDVNFVARRDEMLDVLDQILAYADQRRREGALRVETMASLAESLST